MELTKNYKVNKVIGTMNGAKVNVGDILIVSGLRSTLGKNIDIEDFNLCCTPYYSKEELRIQELEEEVDALKDRLKTRTKLRKPNKMLNDSEKLELDKCIARGMSNPEIAEKFGVSQSMVSRRRPKAEENNNESATDYVQGLGD